MSGEEKVNPPSGNSEGSELRPVLQPTWSGRRDLNPRPSPWQGEDSPKTLAAGPDTCPKCSLHRVDGHCGCATLDELRRELRDLELKALRIGAQIVQRFGLRAYGESTTLVRGGR